MVWEQFDYPQCLKTHECQGFGHHFVFEVSCDRVKNLAIMISQHDITDADDIMFMNNEVIVLLNERKAA